MMPRGKFERPLPEIYPEIFDENYNMRPCKEVNYSHNSVLWIGFCTKMTCPKVKSIIWPSIIWIFQKVFKKFQVYFYQEEIDEIYEDLKIEDFYKFIDSISTKMSNCSVVSKIS